MPCRIFIHTFVKRIKCHGKNSDRVYFKHARPAHQTCTRCICHSARRHKRLLLRTYSQPSFCMHIYDAGAEKINRMQLLNKNSCSCPGYTFNHMLFRNNTYIYYTSPRTKSPRNNMSANRRRHIYSRIRCVIYIYTYHFVVGSKEF